MTQFITAIIIVVRSRCSGMFHCHYFSWNRLACYALQASNLSCNTKTGFVRTHIGRSINFWTSRDARDSRHTNDWRSSLRVGYTSICHSQPKHVVMKRRMLTPIGTSWRKANNSHNEFPSQLVLVLSAAN